jgi:magnesium-transporting ATPase (P-type)
MKQAHHMRQLTNYQFTHTLIDNVSCCGVWMCGGSFWKNLVFPLPMVLFSFHSLNSAQVCFIPILMSCFNLFFTSLPPLVTGWYERDQSDHTLLTQPHLYAAFRKTQSFSVGAAKQADSNSYYVVHAWGAFLMYVLAVLSSCFSSRCASSGSGWQRVLRRARCCSI